MDACRPRPAGSARELQLGVADFCCSLARAANRLRDLKPSGGPERALNYSGVPWVIVDSNGRVEVSPNIVRVVSNQAYGSYIAYFDFAADQTESQIQQQVDYFSKLGIGFEWKTYATDHPNNIESSLLAHGFAQEEQEAFMVLDIAAVESQPVQSPGLQRVTDEQGVRDVIQVQQHVW